MTFHVNHDLETQAMSALDAKMPLSDWPEDVLQYMVEAKGGGNIAYQMQNKLGWYRLGGPHDQRTMLADDEPMHESELFGPKAVQAERMGRMQADRISRARKRMFMADRDFYSEGWAKTIYARRMTRHETFK